MLGSVFRYGHSFILEQLRGRGPRFELHDDSDDERKQGHAETTFRLQAVSGEEEREGAQ